MYAHPSNLSRSLKDLQHPGKEWNNVHGFTKRTPNKYGRAIENTCGNKTLNVCNMLESTLLAPISVLVFLLSK